MLTHLLRLFVASAEGRGRPSLDTMLRETDRHLARLER